MLVRLRWWAGARPVPVKGSRRSGALGVPSTRSLPQAGGSRSQRVIKKTAGSEDRKARSRDSEAVSF